MAEELREFSTNRAAAGVGREDRGRRDGGRLKTSSARSAPGRRAHQRRSSAFSEERMRNIVCPAPQSEDRVTKFDNPPPRIVRSGSARPITQVRPDAQASSPRWVRRRVGLTSQGGRAARGQEAREQDQAAEHEQVVAEQVPPRYATSGEPI